MLEYLRARARLLRNTWEWVRYLMQRKDYARMQQKFQECFDQELTAAEIVHKKGGIIGEDAMPLGKYIWGESHDFIEYYVQWLPHYRGDSHGKIYVDGRHEHLDTLPQIGEVTQDELDLRAYLDEKGLLNLWG